MSSCQNPEICIHFHFQSVLFWVTQPFIILKMMTQTGMGVGSVTFPRMEPIRGHYVFPMSKFRNVYTFCIDNYYLE